MLSPPPSSLASSSSHKENHESSADICVLRERHKYHSWPTEEHAAFAFACLASPGKTSISFHEFAATLKALQLDFNLGRQELRRVFDSMDENNDQELSLEEFQNGRTEHPFTKSLVEALSGAGSLSSSEQCESGAKFPDPAFDCSMSTAEFYSAPLSHGFVGENSVIRGALDYSYHNNYTPCRQHWQDSLIKSNVLLSGLGSDNPWLVLTCGPMGAGKGWVLGWMSANGILPLEKVSKIDPDAFKLRMPEWCLYQQESIEVAGTMTHTESSYIAEIAQRLAMNNGMDLWIDGSLRQWHWYQQELQRIRRRYPHYRIAIVAIDAPQHLIDQHLEKRAKATGRHVPKDLQHASAQGIERGLRQLTHLVDLIAHVSNDGISDEQSSDHVVSAPTLKSVSLIDRSGDWDVIRQLTSTR